MKLLIADDERAVRETIAAMLAWPTFDIELLPLCANGIEAYDLLLDENPDIVITDICMPGLSGLEFIERAVGVNSATQFIILSGYNDFKYAQTALSYGVMRYLLKPCTVAELTEAVESAKKEVYRRKMLASFAQSERKVREEHARSMVNNLLMQGLVQGVSLALQSSFAIYGQYIDLEHTAYELCAFSHCTQDAIANVQAMTVQYQKDYAANVCFHSVYINDVMYVFTEVHGTECVALDMLGLALAQNNGMQYQRETHACLYTLVLQLLEKSVQFGTMILFDGMMQIPLHNHQSIWNVVDDTLLSLSLLSAESCVAITKKIQTLARAIKDVALLKNFAMYVLLKLPQIDDSFSTVRIATVLQEICQKDTRKLLLDCFIEQLNVLLVARGQVQTISAKISLYTQENLENENLTLRWICANVLYMNVDYVGKCFAKETGMKFSTYLTQHRIARAKYLLQSNQHLKVQTIARQVGYGDNYPYFCQIFKRETGQTPTGYAKECEEKNS